jgi:ribosomal protein S18 acetylase RimI-like enzyme
MNQDRILMDALTYRLTPHPGDIPAIERLVAQTAFFNEEELQIARELIEERLCRGEESGYLFLLAEKGPDLAGFTCYGPIPGTQGSFDLYWIVVHRDLQKMGLGLALMRKTEELIAARGGRRIYVDTSLRDQYTPTRTFYLKCGYRQEACLENFYAPGDGKAIYVKVLDKTAG